MASASSGGVVFALWAPLLAVQSAHNQLAREIFSELIEINTTDSSGSTTKAADAMAARLKAAGIAPGDIEVLGPDPRKGNLVARYRGNGSRKPILLLAHLDVVEAKRADWSFEPFQFLERDGYFYGRGTTDDKAQAAIWIANLIRLKQENFKPDRDIIVALTAGEESGVANGVNWLLKEHRSLVDAQFALNEGGGGVLKNGKRLLNAVQASEKIFLTFQLEVANRGGHSSLPIKDNAIYHLAQGLSHLAAFDFPVRLNEVTRTYFERMSPLVTGQISDDMRAISITPPDPMVVSRLSSTPYYNALMRTTCVATRLEAGHAENALPQTAQATVNCRLLPDDSPQNVEQTLQRVLADSRIIISTLTPAKLSPASPLQPEILQPIERITKQMWPGVPVVPTMSAGATDGRALRAAGIPTYGVDGLFTDSEDVRAHGKDERMLANSFYEGQEFLYRLVKTLSTKQ